MSATGPDRVRQCRFRTRPAAAGRAVTPCPKGLVAKPNYGFEKRQKELAKQQKRQAKAEKKASRLVEADGEPAAESADPTGNPTPE